MTITQAQAEMRLAYLGGFMGQLASALVWFMSAGLATWASSQLAIIVLVVGGLLIFPMTRLGLWLIGHQVRTSDDNLLNGLAMQVAFVLPLSLPVAAAATLFRLNWFYPSFMILVGAHYLPFVFLYGMRMFALLCAILVSAGIALALYLPQSFTAGGWLTAAVLFAFALLGRWSIRRELAQQVTAS